MPRTAALAPLRPLANLGLSANFATNAHGGINFNRLRPHNRQVVQQALGIGAGSSRGEHSRGGNGKGASGHGHGATGSMSGEWGAAFCVNSDGSAVLVLPRQELADDGLKGWRLTSGLTLG